MHEDLFILLGGALGMAFLGSNGRNTLCLIGLFFSLDLFLYLRFDPSIFSISCSIFGSNEALCLSIVFFFSITHVPYLVVKGISITFLCRIWLLPLCLRNQAWM